MKLIDFMLPQFGIIKGRDAIDITQIISRNPRSIEVIGSVSTHSFSNKSHSIDKFILLRFSFQGVIMFKVFDEAIQDSLTKEEFDLYAGADTESVVMEIQGSKLSEKNEGLNGFQNLHHIVLETYDFIIECVCELLTVEKVSG